MHLSNKTTAQIAGALNCSMATVRLWVNKHRQGGFEALKDHRKFNSRPRKTTLEQDELINEYFSNDPFSTAARFVDLVNAEVCAGTIISRLHEMHIRSRQPAVKFQLSDEHCQQRLLNALQYQIEEQEFWRNVVCMDEKCFSTSEDGRKRVWRKNGSRLRRNNVVEKKHSGRISCNFWGCCSSYGVGPLQEVEARLNSLRQ